MTSSEGAKRRYWLAGRREDGQDRYFREALDADLWEAGDADHWDACWYTGMPKPDVYEKLSAGDRINHIPGNNALTIKSRLAQSLETTRLRVSEECGANSPFARRASFYPDTFPLPERYHALQDAAHANPDIRWILKPRNSARGQGISLVRDIAAVPKDAKWMVQRYLERAHLMHGHKYVLRLYVLITSVEPLRAYLYHEGFAKLASEPYDLNAPFNIFSHLTNPDINATNTESETPVVFIPFSDYRGWLRDQGHDDTALFAKLRDLVTITMISARDHMAQRMAELGPHGDGAYEIIGLDCLVDADLEPWILECNLSPSLDICAAPEDGGIREEEIKSQLVKDMVAMLGFNETRPRASDEVDAPQARIIAQAEEENARSGGWQRLIPADDPAHVLPFFSMPRAADMVLADAVAGAPVARPRIIPAAVSEIVGTQTLSLFAQQNGRLYKLNEMASWIWLHAIDGQDPDTIANGLIAMHPDLDEAGRFALRETVWRQLGEWVELGLLRKQAPESVGAPMPLRSAHAYLSDREADDAAAEGVPAWQALAGVIGGKRVHVATPVAALATRVGQWPGFEAAPVDAAMQADHRIALHRSRRGYAVIVDDLLVASDVLAGAIGPRVHSEIMHRIPGADDAGVLACPIVRFRDPKGALRHALICPSQAQGWDDAAITFARAVSGDVSFGFLLDADPGRPGLGLGLPARLSENRVQALREAASGEETDDHGRGGALAGIGKQVHVWPGGDTGHFVYPDTAMPDEITDIDMVLLPEPNQAFFEGVPIASVDFTDALPPLLQRFYVGQAVPSAASHDAVAVGRLVQWLEGRRLVRVAEAALPAIGETLRNAATPGAAVQALQENGSRAIDADATVAGRSEPSAARAGEAVGAAGPFA